MCSSMMITCTITCGNHVLVTWQSHGNHVFITLQSHGNHAGLIAAGGSKGKLGVWNTLELEGMQA